MKVISDILTRGTQMDYYSICDCKSLCTNQLPPPPKSKNHISFSSSIGVQRNDYYTACSCLANGQGRAVCR